MINREEMTRSEAEREAWLDTFRPVATGTVSCPDPWQPAVDAGKFTAECPGDDRCECF